MIFLDTYLNLITPKCVLYEKLKDIKKENAKMNKRIAELEEKSQELRKTNKALIELFKSKFPDSDFSKVEEIDI